MNNLLELDCWSVALTFHLKCVSSQNNLFCIIGVTPQLAFFSHRGVDTQELRALALTRQQNCCKSTLYWCATFGCRHSLMDSYSWELYFYHPPKSFYWPYYYSLSLYYSHCSDVFLVFFILSVHSNSFKTLQNFSRGFLSYIIWQYSNGC